MPSPRPPQVERQPRRRSAEAELAREKTELRKLLQRWSQAAAARGISAKAIRTVRIATELGADGWPADADAPPLTAATAYEPCTEMRCVAFTRYCLEHHAERDSPLGRDRLKELARMHGLANFAEALAQMHGLAERVEALTPEVEAHRKAKRGRSVAVKERALEAAPEHTARAEAIRGHWDSLAKARLPVRNRPARIGLLVKLTPKTVRDILDVLGIKLIKRKKRTRSS